jgi:hypothetical protein
MKTAALPLLLAATLLLGACATDQPVTGASAEAASGAPASNALPVTDIPIPAGAKLDSEGTFIMGADDRWLGRIAIRTDSAAVQVYNHFFAGMPGLGWTPVTAVQARVSSLTFARGERVATIQIEPTTLSGTKIYITVSPRQMPAQEAAPARDERAARKARQK